MNREIAWLYTDGPLEHSKTVKGIGCVCFNSLTSLPGWFGECMNPNTPGYEHIRFLETLSRILGVRCSYRYQVLGGLPPERVFLV